MSYVSAVAPDVPRLLKNERQMFYEDLHGKRKMPLTARGAAFIVHFLKTRDIVLTWS
jgi:hypothetical protein